MQYIITNGEKYLKQGIDSRFLAVDNLNDASTWQVKVTIRIKDNGELMELLHDLNYKCFHEVSVVKIKTEPELSKGLREYLSR